MDMDLVLDQAWLLRFPTQPGLQTLPHRLQVYLEARLVAPLQDCKVKVLLIERSIDPRITPHQAYCRLGYVLQRSLMHNIEVEKIHPDGTVERRDPWEEGTEDLGGIDPRSLPGIRPPHWGWHPRQ